MGEIRIVSGRFRGRNIEAPEGRVTRPLLTRLRKSLVDTLRPRLAGSRVLDLFGGSGAIAFELLSNGASEAVVVELDEAAARAIEGNARVLGASVRVRRGDCLVEAPRLDRAGERFDVIIVAPPYQRGLQESAMEMLARTGLLARGGIVVVQRDHREPQWPGGVSLVLTETRRYGRTVFDFYSGGKE